MGTIKNKIIYILPGWTYNSERWGDLIDLLKKSNLEVVKLKTPGLEEKISKPWDIKDYTDWLDEKLKNEDKEIILIGHSNGGRIALSYVINHPGKISRLILIGSAGLQNKKITYVLKKKTFKVIATLGKKIKLPYSSRKLLYKFAREKDYYNADENLKITMQNLIKINLENDLQKINIPTYIIWGEKDKITPIDFAKILNREIKNSKLFVIPNAKHSPQYTNTEKVSKIINDFIK